MSRRRDPIRALALVALLLLAGCTTHQPVTRAPEGAILIGAFDFGESEVLAHIYGGALEAEGYPVHVLDRVASREIMEPALEERGMTPLEAAPATNSNVIVVTQETAERLHLERITDLQAVDGDLVFGGPPECPSRPLCLVGLEETYELSFGTFQPLDAGGPVTLGALLAGEIDVALLFETDPDISGHDLVVLRDDRHLQPAEHVVPVIRTEVLDDHGDGLSAVLNDVSEEITTDELRRLNGRIDDTTVAPADVAAEWLEEKGLVDAQN